MKNLVNLIIRLTVKEIFFLAYMKHELSSQQYTVRQMFLQI